MKIKQGDTILIITGDDKGRTATVSGVSSSTGRIQAEGINVQKKHRAPRKEGEKGQIVKKSGFISISNVRLVCPKCKKATRINHKITSGKKIRICQKCKQGI